MSDKIYYVGRNLDLASKYKIAAALNLTQNQVRNLHTTIIYSRKWFPYKPEFKSIILEPRFLLGNFPTNPDLFVIRYGNFSIKNRHIQFKKQGATWDHPSFLSHITLPGLVLSQKDREKCPIQLDIDYLQLESEYYMTWEEEEKE